MFKKTKKSSEKLTRLQRFSLFFFDHLKTSLALWIAIVIFGVLSYTVLLQREGFPSINLPYSTVTGAYFVNDQQKVDADIAKPATEAIAKLPDVKTVTSSADKNFVVIQIEYKEGTDAKSASATVQSTVEGLKLPDTAELQYQSIDFTRFDNKYDLLVSVFSPTTSSSQDLQAKAQKVADELQGTNHVAGTKVISQTESAVNPVTGQTVTQQKTFDRTAVQENGQVVFRNSVSVGVVAKPDTDTLKLYDAVNETLQANNTSSTQAIVSGSTAESVKEQISSLQSNLLEGLIIVAIISLLLISWRAGIATSLSMATVLLATIAGLKVFGYSLNTITLFALILSLGLIVDDTIIVAEAIDAGKQDGKTKREVVALAIKRVARASTTGTLVTILAFAPMLFIGGILGSFIKALPVTIIISLVFSLLVSLSLIPFLARHLILKDLGKKKHESRNPVIRAEHAVSTGLSRTILWTKGRRGRKAFLAGSAIFLSMLALVGSFAFFSKLKFDIFAPSKDGDEMSVSLHFAPGTTVAQAEKITDNANVVISKTLGSNAKRVVYKSAANGQNATADVVLIPFQDREQTAPQLKQDLTQAFQGFSGAVVKTNVSGAGGPTDEQPFKAQINATDQAKASRLADDMVQFLNTTVFKRANRTTFRAVDAEKGGLVSITRKNGQQIFTVNAGFDAEDTSALVVVTQAAVEKEFNAEKLASYGLSKDTLKFDFGNESNNQESFKSMLMAFPVLILVMFILLVVQFRSLLQPLLILLAIPFSFFGVAFGLFITDNSLSFFVMIGFFALIGIAVNNTIMLVDYANQSLKSGSGYTDAIAQAVQHRFRPLLTTSLVSVVALTPLALSDPFWQSLAVTLIFGLISSTFLVIVAFPYFWLIGEWLRLKGRNGWRKLRKS